MDGGGIYEASCEGRVEGETIVLRVILELSDGGGIKFTPSIESTTSELGRDWVGVGLGPFAVRWFVIEIAIVWVRLDWVWVESPV